MRTMNGSTWIRLVAARRLIAAAGAVALCMTVSTVAAPDSEKRPIHQEVKRAAPEVAVGGMTQEMRIAQHAALHGWLMAEMPADALLGPISAELTDQDRADLAEPYAVGTPMLIGVVNPISRPIRVSQGKGIYKIPFCGTS